MELKNIFRRKELADELAELLAAEESAGTARSGLMLTAPRGTGKSVFLRKDLVPALERRGVVVIVADLWANPEADPADVILQSVNQALKRHEGIVARWAQAIGLERVGFGGLSFSIARQGTEGLWLNRALAALSDKTRRPIVLVLDEVQQCMTTSRGSNLLFSLKAARDAVSLEHYGLRVIATGSHRAKLMTMLGNSEVFFCSKRISLPPLDGAYLNWFRAQYRVADDLRADVMAKLFRRAGYRPDVFRDAVVEMQAACGKSTNDREAEFASAIDAELHEIHKGRLLAISMLPTVQAAVIRVMATIEETRAGFNASTMDAYAQVVRHIDAKWTGALDVDCIVQALDMLVAIRLVWKSTLGIYMLEDSTLASAMRQAGLLEIVPDIPGLGRFDETAEGIGESDLFPSWRSRRAQASDAASTTSFAVVEA